MSHPKFIVVVGASAGGLKALMQFVEQLKPKMDCAIFIVMHLSPCWSRYLFNR